MANHSPLVPTHIGLILDGNRRWARERGLPTLEGHRVGYDNLKEITREAFDNGVKYVSAYIFSTENWDRTAKEIKYLMNLAYVLLTRDVKELNKENIRVVWLGKTEGLNNKLQKAIVNAEQATKDNTRGTLALCFNYGGHDELVSAVQKIVNQGIASDAITKETLQGALYAPDVPQIDLVIRTSGEQRLSGFMLHRISYSELYFTSIYWPDFDKAELHKALDDYASRQRRFGA